MKKNGAFQLATVLWFAKIVLSVQSIILRVDLKKGAIISGGLDFMLYTVLEKNKNEILEISRP